MIMRISFLLALFVTIGCTQNTVIKGFAWDYDFTEYSANSIYFILYQKAETDTGFTVFDTTEVNALSYDTYQMTPLYNFTYRDWFVTAVQHDPSWADSNWSFESQPSNTLHVYFRALPPAPVDSVNGMRAEYIDVGKIPQL